MTNTHRYLVIMRDNSGRGYKAVHDFATWQDREAFIINQCVDAGQEPEEIEDTLIALDRGSVITMQLIEYEYV